MVGSWACLCGSQVPVTSRCASHHKPFMKMQIHGVAAVGFPQGAGAASKTAILR